MNIFHSNILKRVTDLRTGRIRSAAIGIALGIILVSTSDVIAQPVTTTDTGAHNVQKSSTSRDVAHPGKTIIGKASWYGPGLNGRETATGQKFDQNRPTAASTRLPLGSRAVVTNLRNGRSVKVQVNDCGPNVDGRKIDLSKKAAQHLKMTHDGLAPVKIKVVNVPAGAETCQQIKKDAKD